MNSRFSLAVLLTAIILVAGCLSSDESSDTVAKTSTAPLYGLSVTELNAPAEIESGQLLDLSMFIQNTGDAIASNVQAELYQLSGFTTSNANPQTEESALRPADLDTGLTGDSLPLFWTLQAPTVTNDQSKSVLARITYDYTSTASSTVHIVPRDLYLEQGAGAFSVQSTSSLGPISISFVELAPIRIDNPATRVRTVPITILIQNVGSGRVKDAQIRDFELRINGDPVVCSTSEFTLFGAEQSRSITCTLELAFLPGASTAFVLDASIAYTYFFDVSPLTVTVSKKSTFLSDPVGYCYENTGDNRDEQWLSQSVAPYTIKRWVGECGRSECDTYCRGNGFFSGSISCPPEYLNTQPNRESDYCAAGEIEGAYCACS